MTRCGLALLFIITLYILALNAYVIDDAYISFRTIDNLLHGHGLRWNVDERVQVYTHPLWLVLLSLVIAVSGEFHVTTMTVSLVVTLLSLLVNARYLATRAEGASQWKVVLYLVLFLASKAALDYSSSGLENPLTNLLLSVFVLHLLVRGERPGSWKISFLLASFLFVNRFDTVILVLPALALIFFDRRLYSPRRLPALVVCVLPAIVWVAFSTWYYGTPIPNTAYAKAINTGLTLATKLKTGGLYLGHNLAWDAMSYVLLIAGVYSS